MSTMKIEGKTVSCVAKVKIDKNAAVASTIKWVFDFTGCPRNAEMILMARSLKIDVQRDWRTATPAERKSMMEMEILVKDYVAGKKRKLKAPPTAKAVSELLGQLTDAERTIVMAEHSKK